MNLNQAKSILITGGTGSFGKEFLKKILKDYPNLEKVIIFSRDEFKHFTIQNMAEFKNDERIRYFIGDVRDLERLKMAFSNVDIVIHAAALKQVPLCEYNPFEAVKTNIMGAQNIITAAIENNVKKVIALSTDKACSPVNLYGATKLCSDKLFIAANAYSGDEGTRFSVVRYGNVSASRGSVIPFFMDCIKNNAEFIPITDPRMTRFWLKLDQAVEMVIEVCDIMKGEELFVKKIPSVKVTDIAKAIAPNIEQKVVGIRPGEKLHEMMISSDDARNTIDIGGYYVILPEVNAQQKSVLVNEDFIYRSDINEDWLSIEQIEKFIKSIN